MEQLYLLKDKLLSLIQIHDEIIQIKHSKYLNIWKDSCLNIGLMKNYEIY